MNEPSVIPKKEFEDRVKRTHKLMRERGLDALLAFSGYQEREGHVCYLTNHHIAFPNIMSHIGLGYAAVVLPSDGKPILISPLGYQEEVVVGIEYAKTGNVLFAEIVNAIKEKNLDKGKIGIVGMDVLPVQYYEVTKRSLPKAVFETADDVLEFQRAIKSPAELELLREAARIADEGLKAGIEAAKEGVPEYKVGLAATKAAYDAGADFVVRTRIASGKIRTLTWPMASRKKLKEGEILYLDFIGWYKNYAFDISRVTVVGKPTEEQKEVINGAVKATEWMIEVIKPRIERYFVASSMQGKTVIPLAHGIGIDVAENPWIFPGTKITLKPNMVLCVEPGVIIPELGTIHIEDEVIVTETGVDVITRCPRVFW